LSDFLQLRNHDNSSVWYAATIHSFQGVWRHNKVALRRIRIESITCSSSFAGWSELARECGFPAFAYTSLLFVPIQYDAWAVHKLSPPHLVASIWQRWASISNFCLL
jgi:hypothetical protein